MVGPRVTAIAENPVPVRPTACGLLEALSKNSSEALRLPVPVGANATLRVQLSVGLIAAPVQLSALVAKSPAFMPSIATFEMVRISVPELVTVAVRGELGTPTFSVPNGRLTESRLTPELSEIFAI